MILTDLLSMIFRLAELVFACIVAGITGHFLHASRGASAWHLGRFIYTEVVAGLSILLSLLWLLPFAGSFVHWPVDLVLAACWFAAFGLIVDWLGGSCGGAFDWAGLGLRGGASCATWKADEAFAFLSALCWLVSTLLGVYWLRKRTAPGATTTRSRWYRRRARV